MDGTTRIEATARVVDLSDARFNGGLDLTLRKGLVACERVVFGAPSSIANVGTITDTPRTSPNLDDPAPAMMQSLRGTDVSNLALVDMDLSWCLFAGAHRLDTLRMDGQCLFNRPPPYIRYGRRQVVFEEHLWRGHNRLINVMGFFPRTGPGWIDDNPLGGHSDGPSAARVAVVYRSLRKALEDGKNEAGAGDFYYGEMEARRRSWTAPRAERMILAAYGALSGYGQRALRAVAWLLVLVIAVTVLLVGFGLPESADQRISGTVQGTAATFTVADPPAALPSDRWTAARLGHGVQVAVGAVVFRDAGQKLTTAGGWTVIVARFLGPLLLALAVLAVRARVKR